MPQLTPDILALDFDGVVCDGLIEYFQTAWQAYRELFKVEAIEPLPELAERFYPLRPVVESGWEMPILLQALQLGMDDGEILANWGAIAPRLTTEAGLERSQAAAAVDGVRDRWIQADLDNWLSQHRFYPGVLDKIQRAIAEGTELYIISTKEGRFIQQLLGQQGVAIPPEHIFGKEVKQPKYETLRQLYQQSPQAPNIWFVEDRLKALQSVQQQPDLDTVQLFLATWGYNTDTDKQQARAANPISILSLEEFAAPFPHWPHRNS